MKIFSVFVVAALLGTPLWAVQKYPGKASGRIASALLNSGAAHCDSIILKDGRVIAGVVIDSGPTTMTVRYCHDDKVEILDRLNVDRIVYGTAGSGGKQRYDIRRYRRLIGWGIGLTLGSLVLAYPLLALAVIVTLNGGTGFFLFILIALIGVFIAGIAQLVHGLILKSNNLGI